MLHKVCKLWRHYCIKLAKKGVISECLGGEFDFLLIEAPPPRLLKKTKQKVATGDLNITHFPSQRLLFIQVPKQGPTKILAYSDFFLEA